MSSLCLRTCCWCNYKCLVSIVVGRVWYNVKTMPHRRRIVYLSSFGLSRGSVSVWVWAVVTSCDKCLVGIVLLRIIMEQINKFPPKRVENLATPSSIFIFSSSTGELYSQPIRGSDRRIGRMFPEHVERSFLDPEYSFDEYFHLGSRRKVRPIKNGL